MLDFICSGFQGFNFLLYCIGIHILEEFFCIALTFFFYDLETSGINPREDRIMQFAGQRTDLEFNPIGDPVNLFVRLDEDTLPSPYAIVTTNITPNDTRMDGLSEPELCKILQKEIFTPNTIICGFNSVRFDDEFIRYLFWRNFYDPYTW
jgi:exodeoxyribonuclease I